MLHIIIKKERGEDPSASASSGNIIEKCLKDYFEGFAAGAHEIDATWQTAHAAAISHIPPATGEAEDLSYGIAADNDFAALYTHSRHAIAIHIFDAARLSCYGHGAGCSEAVCRGGGYGCGSRLKRCYQA